MPPDDQDRRPRETQRPRRARDRDAPDGLTAPDATVGRFLLGELVDALPEAVLVADPAGRLIWGNGTFARLFRGDQAEAWRGRNVTVLAGPYAAEAEGLRLLEAVREAPAELETELFTSEGESFPAIVRVAPLGADLRLLTIQDGRGMLDLRAELTVKAELVAREREILRATVDSLTDAVLVADDSERIVAVNRPAAELLGVPVRRLRGHALVDLPIPGRLRGAWLAFLGSAESETSFTVSLDVPGEEAARTLAVRLSRARTSTGIPVGSVLVLTDITERLDREERRRRTTASTLDDLLEKLELMRGRIESGPASDCPRVLAAVAQDAARLDAALREARTRLVAPPWNAPARSAPVDVASVLGAARRRVLEAHDLGDEAIRIEPVPHGVTADADADALGLVVEELMTNAVTHGASDRGALVRVLRDGTAVVIEIRDHGPGLSPERLDDLFEPRSGAGAGTGDERAAPRGLPFCREIVTRYGGRLEIHVARGGGLAVRLSLPAART
ncbi:MAG: hypothetical protein Kow0062_02420 [Acidobacteriota bacterium]